jgi:molecular chaperone GrpE (heat shock protein)
MEIEPGDKFNSEIMEAVCTQETDEYNSDVVLEVIETGYMYEDILLRPAKVMVSC